MLHAVMSTRLTDRISNMQKNAAARTAAKRSIAATVVESPIPPALTYQETILQREQKGLLQQKVIHPGQEFPTLLTRLPIFPAVNRKRQNQFLDNDNAYPFSTPFGSGRRIGPPLTVEDEDTLIVLLLLRDRRLKGRGGKLPIPITAGYNPDPDGNVLVDTVTCSVTDILEIKGIKNGGASRKWTLDSIKRLAGTSLEIETNKHSRYFGPMRKGANIKLLDVAWTVYENEGYLLVQFYPVIVDWLLTEYTYISWKIRKGLSDLGKSLHRFLSSQPKYFSRDLVSVAKTIGFDREPKYLRRSFNKALQEMQDLGWLKRFKITGTGRRKPLVLETHR